MGQVSEVAQEAPSGYYSRVGLFFMTRCRGKVFRWHPCFNLLHLLHQPLKSSRPVPFKGTVSSSRLAWYSGRDDKV